MKDSGSTITTIVTNDKDRITWGFCQTNPIVQAIEYYVKQRKNN